MYLELREFYAAPSWTSFVSFDHGSQALGTTNRRKDLSMVPLRCQRLLMRMMWFYPKPEYLPGKQLVVADLLSRKPLRGSVEAIIVQQEEDVSLYVKTIVSQWPASSSKLD